MSDADDKALLLAGLQFGDDTEYEWPSGPRPGVAAKFSCGPVALMR
jgi:hypothetical protein